MVTDGTRVLYERNPDAPVAPASTMKLLTAAAVLQHLDPGSRLRTPVVATSPVEGDGTLNGDLYLIGGGDPVLGTMPYGAHFTRHSRLINAIENLADRIVAAGVHHVTGRIIGDDSRYERLRYLSSWPPKYQTDNETGPLSALTVNDAFEQWSPKLVPFADPAAGAAGVLTALLRERGVQVDNDPASGTAPTGTTEITALDSATIGELVDDMLLNSDNTTAELLLRELGLRVHGTGTTDAGRQVVLDSLNELGLPTAGVSVLDGSGLAHGNRVTCRLLVAILNSAPSRAIITRGLPIAAQTGTLYKRFLATPVAGHLRAKTGSITGVAGLAGFADGADGRTLTFAYEQNNVGSKDGEARQNDLGMVLVTTRR
jgi:D-alanyl-D-alanine carboxypeptidase/D-alanyl-D-alanine-endopeptidase (penicillin-binding protein 4)